MLSEDLLASLEKVARLPSVYDLSCTLLECRRTRNLPHAKQLCTVILSNHDFRNSEELGNYLVPTLIDCGSFYTAQQVFNELDHPNVNSWTALVRGLNDNGNYEQARNVFQRMQAAHVRLSSHAFQALVKTAAWLKDIEFGRDLHIWIAKRGHDDNQILGVTLIELYAKCGAHAEAWAVLEKLPVQDIVSWNILITDCADNGLGEEALNYFRLMQGTSLSPDVVTLVGSLKACSIVQDKVTGRDIHLSVVKLGVETNVIISNTLVDMYMKSTCLEEAQKVFDDMQIRTVVSWNALLTGYAEHGFEKEVLDSLDKMQLQGLSWSHVTVTCALTCCNRVGDINVGCKLHADIVKLGLESYPSVGSSLIEMYMSFGWLDEGQQVFDTLPIHNVVCWTALITGYAEHGLIEVALDEFTIMLSEGVFPDAFLYVCLLDCSSAIRKLDRIFELHSVMAKDGLESKALVASALVNTYISSGLVLEAQRLFDELPVWQALACCVSASLHAEHNLGAQDLLPQVEEMLLAGVYFSSSMLLGSLKICASLEAIDIGCSIHMTVVYQGFERDPSVGVALMAMYFKCSWFAEAQHVHDENIPIRSVSWWNTIILGYAEHSMAEQVMSSFKKMRMDGVHPNETTFMCCLKACGTVGAIMEAFELHAGIASEGLEKDSLVGNSLVAAYAKLGLLSEAWEAFKELPTTDAVSWNSLMAGHADCGLHEEVLSCWAQMQAAFIPPNCISCMLALKACSSLCSVDKGLVFHGEVIAKGFEGNTFIAKGLLDMYAKSGLLAEAWETFGNVLDQSLVLWNALIGGFAWCGRNDLVHYALERMQEDDVEANEQTFTNVLTVCSHAGLIEEGQLCFQDLHTNCCLISLHEHYNCMVDLLGRAGQLNIAVALLEVLPFHPGLVTWRAILGASRKWRNLALGRHAFESVIGLSCREVAAFMLMLNMYADTEEYE